MWRCISSRSITQPAENAHKNTMNPPHSQTSPCLQPTYDLPAPMSWLGAAIIPPLFLISWPLLIPMPWNDAGAYPCSSPAELGEFSSSEFDCWLSTWMGCDSDPSRLSSSPSPSYSSSSSSSNDGNVPSSVRSCVRLCLNPVSSCPSIQVKHNQLCLCSVRRTYCAKLSLLLNAFPHPPSPSHTYGRS